MNKESLTSYTKRFNDKVKLVANTSSSVLINAYIGGLQPFKFFYLV